MWTALAVQAGNRLDDIGCRVCDGLRVADGVGCVGRGSECEANPLCDERGVIAVGVKRVGVLLAGPEQSKRLCGPSPEEIKVVVESPTTGASHAEKMKLLSPAQYSKVSLPSSTTASLPGALASTARTKSSVSISIGGNES